MGPDNKEVSMADVMEIEEMAKRKLPLAEISRRKRLPYWRVEAICRDGRIAVKS